MPAAQWLMLFMSSAQDSSDLVPLSLTSQGTGNHHLMNCAKTRSQPHHAHQVSTGPTAIPTPGTISACEGRKGPVKATALGGGSGNACNAF